MANARTVIAIVLRLIASAVFLLAAVPKLADISAFAQSIDAYRILPPSLVWVSAYFLPWLEITCVNALWFSKWRMAATVILLTLLAIFTIAITYAWATGLDITCGCFGEAYEMSLHWSLARNILLIVLPTAIFVLEKQSITLRRAF